MSPSRPFVILVCLLLACGIIATPLSAGAQAPIQPHDGTVAGRLGLTEQEIRDLRRARTDLAVFYYGSRYAVYVVLGVVVGGYTFALLSFGRTGSTVFGATLGSMVGIWWFLDEFAGDFLERQG